jgi:hypothetical protein
LQRKAKLNKSELLSTSGLGLSLMKAPVVREKKEE